MAIRLKVDERSTFVFLWDELKESHPLLSILLINSIINPFFLRIIGLFMGYSLDFTFNAMFYTDDYIDAQAEVKREQGATGFKYTLLNEFSKSLWSVLISAFIMFLAGLIIRIPLKYRLELNEALKTGEKEKVEKGA